MIIINIIIIVIIIIISSSSNIIIIIIISGSSSSSSSTYCCVDYYYYYYYSYYYSEGGRAAVRTGSPRPIRRVGAIRMRGSAALRIGRGCSISETCHRPNPRRVWRNGCGEISSERPSSHRPPKGDPTKIKLTTLLCHYQVLSRLQVTFVGSPFSYPP